jgi:hypothetical protein
VVGGHRLKWKPRPPVARAREGAPRQIASCTSLSSAMPRFLAPQASSSLPTEPSGGRAWPRVFLPSLPSNGYIKLPKPMKPLRAPAGKRL